MVKVTGPTGPQAPSAPTPTEKTQAPSAKLAVSATPLPEDGFTKAAGGLLGYRSSPLVSGAVKIFGDGVVFPANLTDPKDPRNDPKYFRLLAAVLGLEDLERHFHALEGKEQEEYLEHKAKQREERLAKIEREKEEKKRQRDDAQPQEEQKEDEE